MDRRKGSSLSHSLQAAQEQLEDIRSKVRSAKGDRDYRSPEPPPSLKKDFLDGSALRFQDHLGWGSYALTRSLCCGEQRPVRPSGGTGAAPNPQLASLQTDIELISRRPSKRETIRIFPDLSMALLRNKETAAGRIWLLLKYIDRSGQGWVERREAIALLTSRASEYRVCGRRQLRKLLSKGEDLFWNCSNDRIWLKSTARTAAHLGLRRLSGRPVALPVKVLLKTIGEVRAHLYGCFHSGRTGDRSSVKPIARSTLREISSLSSSTQRSYELRAGISRQVNYALGGKASGVLLENRAWKHGRALFIYKDQRGRFGVPDEEYTAWQLPNSYIGPHDTLPKGRQKAINREIADLFMKGITGNGFGTKDDEKPSGSSASGRYFKSGLAAAALFNLEPHQDKFWKGPNCAEGASQIWHVLSGKTFE